jgi:hypothetical protein
MKDKEVIEEKTTYLNKYKDKNLSGLQIKNHKSKKGINIIFKYQTRKSALCFKMKTFK